MNEEREALEEALETAKATICEMGVITDTLPDLDMDGRLHDVPEDDDE